MRVGLGMGRDGGCVETRATVTSLKRIGDGGEGGMGTGGRGPALLEGWRGPQVPSGGDKVNLPEGTSLKVGGSGTALNSFWGEWRWGAWNAVVATCKASR